MLVVTTYRTDLTAREGFMKLASQNGKRSTKAEMDGLRDRIVRIALASHPLSVRNLFYQLLSDDGSGVTVEKSEAAYQKVGRLKGQLCRDRSIPWHYFSDSSRVSYDNDGFDGLGDISFIDRVASLYRRDAWQTTGIYPQLWVESRSLYPTLAGTARELGVSLYPSGGMSSDSFVHGAAVDAISTERERMSVVYVGDYDPAGLQIAETLETKLTQHLDYAAEYYNVGTPTLTFERVAVTEQQIIDHGLPTKPVKATQSRKRYDIDQTVEAEAMPPDALRRIVADAFEPMVDQHQMRLLRQVEDAERNDLRERLAELVAG